MSSLDSFKKELDELIGQCTDLRPFVCDGSPLDCEVFMVGFNPRTSMSSKFCEFWRAGHGFDKAAWRKAYKKDSPTPSKTRISLERVSDSAAPVKLLETNLYWTPTESAKKLQRHQRRTAYFDFLLATIKPRVIVAYTAKAVRHIHSISNSTDPVADWLAKRRTTPPFNVVPATITVAHGDDAVKHPTTFSARVIPVWYFSRYWKEDPTDVHALGQQVKSECSGT